MKHCLKFAIFLLICVCLSKSETIQAETSSENEIEFLKEKIQKELKEAVINMSDESEDAKLTFEQVVIRKGYPLESHFILTEDGYILKLYRIPGSKVSQESIKQTGNKKLVLLQHGLTVKF